MPIDWGRPGPEPRLDEMVRDPIVQLVMRRDRITAADVMAAVLAARARLQAPPAPAGAALAR